MRLFITSLLCVSSLFAEKNTLNLDLPKAIALALEHNLQIRITQQKRVISLAQESIEKSVFEPEFFANMTYEDNRTQQNAQNFSAIELSLTGADPQQTVYEEANWRYRQGLRGKHLTGLEWQIALSIDRLDNTVNRSNRFFHPEYETFAGLELKQPLLKGRGRDIGRSRIQVAWHEVQMASRETEVLTINRIIELANDYYDLVFAQESHQVHTQALSVAETILKENIERENAGQMEKIEVLEARAKVYEARDRVYLSSDQVREKQFSLIKKITSPGAPLQADQIAVTLPALPELNLKADRLQALAQTKRPDLLLVKERIQQGRWNQKMSRNAKLPKLDLAMRVGVGGLEDDLRAGTSDMLDDGEPRWSIGLDFNQPLGGKRSQAEAAIAKARTHQEELTLERLLHELQYDITRSITRLDTLTKRHESTIHSVTFNSEIVKREMERLKQKRSTTRQVMETQNELDAAKTRELAARVDILKAQAELWSICGILLEKNGFLTWRGEESPEFLDHLDHPNSTKILRTQRQIKKESFKKPKVIQGIEVPLYKEKLSRRQVKKLDEAAPSPLQHPPSSSLDVEIQQPGPKAP
jgi:outer membrane protein